MVDRARPVGRVTVDVADPREVEPDERVVRVRATCRVDDRVVLDDDVRVAPIGYLVADRRGGIVREHYDGTGEVTRVERFRLEFRAPTEAEVIEDLAWLAEQRADRRRR
ncbi:MAG: hypothetical protein U5R31_02995 [Acidimicrobiia bacterium]|nr:hypothetical protein [Acidimicrobiia bacterium]